MKVDPAVRSKLTLAIFPSSLIFFSSVIAFQYAKFGLSWENDTQGFLLPIFKLAASHISVLFWTFFLMSWIFSPSSQNIFFSTSMALSSVAGTYNLLAGLGFSPVSHHEGAFQLIYHFRWAEWMITAPLLALLLGDLIRLYPKKVFLCMLAQFLLVLFGYLAELSTVFFSKVLLFLLSGLFWVPVTSYLTFRCAVFVTTSKTLDVKAIKGMFLCVLLVWICLPIVFLLNIMGSLSCPLYNLCGTFLDALMKLLTLGVCFKVHLLLNDQEQKKGIDNAKEENKMQAKFLRFLYHEIRNPLNTIMLGIGHLQGEPQTSDAASTLATLKKTANVMRRIIDDAVDVSQNQGSLVLITQPTDLQMLVKTVLREFTAKAKEKEISFDFIVSNHAAGQYLVDQAKVLKMYKSLISNAIKFSRRGCTVQVFLKADERGGSDRVGITFSVKDCGPGITESLETTIFQPFENIRPGDFLEDDDRGSGLSLCVTKILADLMGATVYFTTERGAGSVFYITLPCEQVKEELNDLENGGAWATSILGSWIRSARNSRNNTYAQEQRSECPSVETASKGKSRPTLFLTPEHSNHQTNQDFLPRAGGASVRSTSGLGDGFLPRAGAVLSGRSLSGVAGRSISGLGDGYPPRTGGIATARSLSGLGEGFGRNESGIFTARSTSKLLESNKNGVLPGNTDNKVGEGNKALGRLHSDGDLPLPTIAKKLKKSLTLEGFVSRHGPGLEETIHNEASPSINPCANELITSSYQSSARKSFDFVTMIPTDELQDSDSNILPNTSSSEFKGDSSEAEILPPQSQPQLTSGSHSQKTECSSRSEMRDFFPDTNSRGKNRIHPTFFSASSPAHSPMGWEEMKFGDECCTPTERMYTRRTPGSARNRRTNTLHSDLDSNLATLREVEINQSQDFSVHSQGTTRNKLTDVLARDALKSKAQSTGTIQHHGCDILIVDDVQSNVKLTDKILTKAGYTCETACNGAQAVEMAKNNSYKLILMDNVMPIMNGIEASRQILKRNSSIVIVGMTGNVLQSDQDEFLKVGVRSIVLKPVDKATLLGICEEYIK